MSTVPQMADPLEPPAEGGAEPSAERGAALETVTPVAQPPDGQGAAEPVSEAVVEARSEPESLPEPRLSPEPALEPRTVPEPESRSAPEAPAEAPAAELAPASPSTVNREFQELWFTLVRKNWKSIVLVPADEGLSVGPIAQALAEVGGKLRDGAVTAIVEDRLDYASAARIAAIVASKSSGGGAPAEVIVAIQPVVVEPLGLAVAQAADAVVLCFEMTRTRLSAARRTIELIGRDRIAGTFLVR